MLPLATTSSINKGSAMSSLEADVKATIRNIPDFPKPGILFKDITPILSDASLMRRITDSIVQEFSDKGIDVVIGMESRGFIFGVPVAMELGAAFVPARKPGKLPYDRIGVDYDLEYGSARLEIHTDAIEAGQKVLIVDDLLATGGTAKATVQLAEMLGGEVVSCVFVVELSFLGGRSLLTSDSYSIATF
ncbi:MAG: adenine phosphoribosyltransferase [Myxococcota bacterium]|jgi:adenine phosphoribosyltransferase